MNLERDTQPNINAMLVRAQREFTPVVFDKFNPHFKNKYASLASIKNAIQPSLNKHGFFISQPFEWKESGDIVLSTRLVHESGAIIELASCLIKKEGKDDQKFGGAITYQRRYQLSSAFFLFAEEDDDGEAAVGRVTQPEPVQHFRVTKEQEKIIRELTKDKPEIRESIYEYYGIKVLGDLPQKAFEPIVKRLQEKESA